MMKQFRPSTWVFSILILFYACSDKMAYKGLNIHDGVSLTYQFTVETYSEIDYKMTWSSVSSLPNIQTSTESSPFSKEKIHSFCGGDISVTGLGNISSDTILLRFKMENLVVKLERNGQSVDKQSISIGNELQEPIYGLVDPDGKICRLYFAPSLPSFTRNFACSVLAGLQWLPQPVSSYELNQWEAEEFDQHGLVKALYAKTNEEYVITRQKIAVSNILSNSMQNIMPAEMIPSGSMQMRWEPEEQMSQSIEGTENYTFLVSGKEAGTSTIKLKYNLISLKKVQEATRKEWRGKWKKWESTGSFYPLYMQIDEKEQRMQTSLAQLGRESYSGLLTWLGKSERAKKNDDVNLYLKLKALVVVHPEYADSLGLLLLNTPEQSFRFRIVADALAFSGAPGSQKNLRNLALSLSDGSNRQLEIIGYISKIPNPEPTTLQLLESWININADIELYRRSSETYGICIRHLNTSNPKIASISINWLLKQAIDEKEIERLIALVGGLGKSGRIEPLELLSLYSGNEYPTDLRTAALLSIGKIQDPAAFKLLKLNLQDPQLAIRSACIQAFSEREPDQMLLQLLSNTFTSEPNEVLRIKRLYIIWSGLEIMPDLVKKMITSTASNDPSISVRKAAKDIMKTHRYLFQE